MRKVFLVLLALSLSSMFVACSEDDSTKTPADVVDELAITTATSLNDCYTCSPYNVQLEATGGVEPYTWSLATGSSLPTGFEMTTDGRIMGMKETASSHSFTVTVTDAESNTDQATLSLDIAIPANPSVAIFFDTEASVCTAETQFPAVLDCYVYIMLEGTNYECAKGASFSIDLVDVNENTLDPSQFVYTYTDYPDYTLPMGNMSSGLAVTFTRPMQYYGPVEVMSFGLMLLESVDELAFRLGPNPNEVPVRTSPIFMSCEDGYPLYEVMGRDAAINYPSAQ